VAGVHTRTLENTMIAQSFAALPWPTHTHPPTPTHMQNNIHTNAHTHTRTHAQDHKTYTDTYKFRNVEVPTCFLAYARVLAPFSEGVQVDVLFFAGSTPWQLQYLSSC
jgi:hypothetical protein